MTNSPSQLRSGTIEICPLSVNIGAEIQGVDLSSEISVENVAAIRSALLRWKVVIFATKISITKVMCVSHGILAGLLQDMSFFGGDEEYPEIYSVAKHRTANYGKNPVRRSWTDWHTDITAAVNPPAASILRGDIVPPYGGDTYWTNFAVAYERLSRLLQEFVSKLRGIHSLNEPTKIDAISEYDKKSGEHGLVAEHSLVNVHPETDERVLYVSLDFVKRIAGLNPRES